MNGRGPLFLHRRGWLAGFAALTMSVLHRSAVAQPAPATNLGGSSGAFAPEVDAPWLARDFRDAPEAYMAAVTGRLFEGFALTLDGGAIRLTSRWRRNPISAAWGVAFPNEAAATELALGTDLTSGAVRRRRPSFGPGAAIARLVFVGETDATPHREDGAPRLVIATGGQSLSRFACSATPDDRSLIALRYVGVQVAIRDARSAEGWVMGVTSYDETVSASSPWTRLRLRQLTWGDEAAEENAVTPSDRVSGLVAEGEDI